MTTLNCGSMTTEQIINDISTLPHDATIEIVYWNGNRKTDTVSNHLKELIRGLLAEDRGIRD